MKISIACCTYNGADYLLPQLESFAAQTLLPDELIVCDDHSTDATLEILQAFAKRAPFPVRVMLNPDAPMGTTKNFERAIAACSGQIIVLSDQDDCWYEDKLASIHLAFEQGAELVFSNADLVDANLNSLGYSLFDSLSLTRGERKMIAQQQFSALLLKGDFVTGATAAFSSKHLPLLLPISDHWVHDGWIATLIAAVAPVKMLEASLLQYRQHARNQIGAGKLGVSARLQKAKKYGVALYQRKLCGFIDLKQRLLQSCPDKLDDVFLEHLDHKIQHLEVRALVGQQSLRSFARLSMELITGRYHAFSRGWLSYFRDVMLLCLEVSS